jgi:hypothetical protein
MIISSLPETDRKNTKEEGRLPVAEQKAFGPPIYNFFTMVYMNLDILCVHSRSEAKVNSGVTAYDTKQTESGHLFVHMNCLLLI